MLTKETKSQFHTQQPMNRLNLSKDIKCRLYTKSIALIVLMLLLDAHRLIAQEISLKGIIQEYPTINYLLPGYSRIQAGDASGYWTVAGTTMALASSAYLLTRQKGLNLWDDLPYALAVIASDYGTDCLVYNLQSFIEEKKYPDLQPMSFGELLLTPFRFDFSTTVDLSSIGIVGVAALLSITPCISDVGVFFSSGTVPLWGIDMNPYLAATLMLGYTAITNVLVATTEETINRSMLLDDTLLGTGNSEVVSLLGSSVIFGAVHLTNILLNVNDGEYRNQVIYQAINATLMGFILGSVYLSDSSPNRRAGFGNAVRLHYLWNVMAMNTDYWIEIGKAKHSGTKSAVSRSASSNGITVTPCSIMFHFSL
jgi:CAAX amino terminal protease family.